MKKYKLVFGLILILSFILSWHKPAIAAISDSNPKPQVRREIIMILADQRFAYPDYLAWWNKSWPRLSHWIAQFKWRQSAKKLPIDTFLNQALNYFGLFLLILLPFILVFFVPRLFQKEVRLKQTAKAEHSYKPDTGQLLQKAAALAGEGLTLEALRHVYLAVLEHFHHQKLFRYDVNFSDKENLILMRKAFGPDHRAYVAFSKLVRLFQEKWYGLKNCQATDYDTARSLAEIIMEKVGRPNA